MDRFRYIVEDALTNLRRSGWGGVASVATIAVSFVIVGIFLIITGNLGALVADWKEQFQVTVFLEDGITGDQLALLRKRVQSERAVRSMTYTSKAEALQQFKREMQGKESLLEGLGENPIPASLQIRVHEAYQTPEALKQLTAALSRLEGVEDVMYGQEWVDRLSSVIQVLRLLGLSVGLALGLASLLIVSNTIRLAVYARAEEIEVMRLVGATRLHIRLPFVLEGVIQGTLGAVLALLLLFGAYRATLWQIEMTPGQIFGMGVGSFLAPEWVVLMVVVGAGVGAFGSLISVGRFLRA
ncbi:MAG: putative Cell division protein FtsX [candidate division NC10 bacterium]|jgi:cell division transport system permease protein|nr:putative Cell division protein FtsX [candidate division NC10 bacterium]